MKKEDILNHGNVLIDNDLWLVIEYKGLKFATFKK